MEGSLCARFLAVRQMKSVAEYRERFEALASPLPHLSNEVLEGLEAMMKAAQRIEDKNSTLLTKTGSGGTRSWKPSPPGVVGPTNALGPSYTPKLLEPSPIKIITLPNTISHQRKEAPLKRLTDSELQYRREKGLCY